MKVLGVALVLLLILIVGVFVYVGYNTNSIVKNAIETIGTQYLGASVKVKEVEISLQEGRGTLKGLEIGNPPGYTSPYAMRFGAVSLEIDAAHSGPDLIVLKRITIDGARAAAIANTPKDTNFSALSSNLRTSSERSTIKLIVDKFDLTNTQASVTSPSLSRSVEVNVPDVHLTDVGRSSKGVDAGALIAQVLAPITKAVTRSMTEAGMKSLGVDPNQLKSDATQRMRETLKSLGHPTN